MKRTFDLVFLIVTFPFWGPLWVILAILVRIYLGRPVHFIQQRPGKNGELFYLVKLRTMMDKRAPNGEMLPDHQRMTRFGTFLRSSSLDELPELLNVLKGEMSLVGPRPLMVQYLSRYSAFQARRHEVLPGITGWAQINGRNNLSWEERFKLDVWYVDNRSFWLDLRILVQTIKAVLGRKGVSAEGEATMSEFKGSPEQDR